MIFPHLVVGNQADQRTADSSPRTIIEKVNATTVYICIGYSAFPASFEANSFPAEMSDGK